MSESKIEEVWRWVIDEQVRIIGIYGIGGVGKTTLLKQIYKRLTISPHNFDTVIWVTVSQNLSVEKVQDDIWKRIGVFDVEWVDKSFHEKAQAIRRVLSKKKFVLLLDDLGRSFDLRKLGVPCPGPKQLDEDINTLSSQDSSEQLELIELGLTDSEENDCKVVLTTRSQDVCSEMGTEEATIEMETLEWKDAWKLFKEKVGEDKLVDPKIQELAQLIVPTCRGLPMLLCTVGRAMASRRTYDEWLGATQRLRGVGKSDSEYVFQLLKFCYDSFDRQGKSCLLYYSLFPEDFTIRKNELIDFWICQQLLGHLDIEADVLESGYKTLDALIGASLLEEEEVNYVKLLDLIRDFALRVETRPIMFRSPPFVPAPENMQVGWVLPMRNSIHDMAFVSHNFFAFLLKYNPFIILQEPFDIFPQTVISTGNSGASNFVFQFLTALDLSNSGVEEIPREIGKLVLLEYLNLSNTWIEQLPVDLQMLDKLKCLNLEYAEQLRVIPKQLISSLLSLQVLKMFRCGFSVEEIEDNVMSATHMDIDPIFDLEHLKVLSITITSIHALCKFFSSHKLLNCTQSLSLEIFWGSKSLDISPIATMKNLLTLEVRQVEDLKELNGFPQSFEFVRERSFEKLQEITLEKCSSLLELTWVILVPNLKILRVKSCEEIEEIISIRRMGEIFNDVKDLEPFAKLEILVLESLVELRSIYWEALPLRCLKKIEVTECYSLRKLPLNSNSANKNEVIIEAEEDWWVEIEWEDDVTKNNFLPCFRAVEVD